MSTKITVNGVEYESVEAMPPDVRRTYEEIMAKFPDMAQLAADGPAEIREGSFGPVKVNTAVQKKIVVNNVTYENEESMPPDVRQAYELGMRTLHDGDPNVKTNEIKMSFQVNGPHFTFTKTLGGPSPQTGMHPAGPATSEPTPPLPRPIEPTSAENGVRVVLLVTACAVIGLALWFMARLH